jgi:hypothetical protein
LKLIREGLSLIFNGMPAGCCKYLQDTDVDVIFDEPRVFIETLDNVNNKVLFDFLIQLRIRFRDVGGVMNVLFRTMCFS